MQKKIFSSHGLYSSGGNKEALRDGVRHKLEVGLGMSPEFVLAFFHFELSFASLRYLILAVSNCL